MAARALVFLLLLASPLSASAQPRTSQPFTGYELALSGGGAARAGRTARYHGVAYRVRGLAELVPYAGPVRARIVRASADEDAVSFVDVVTGADGRFVVDLPVAVAEAVDEAAELQVTVGPGDEGRRFELPIDVQPAVELLLRTDRILYEAGEPVHVFGLLRDVASGRPLPGVSIDLSIYSEVLASRSATVRSDSAGVVTMDLQVPENANEGGATVTAEIAGQRTVTARFRVGTRTYERVFAEIDVEPDPVAPGGTARVLTAVTTSSGVAVAGASVTLRVDGDTTYEGVTGPDGRSVIEVRAPSYLRHSSGWVSIAVGIHHPAHGSLSQHTSMRLEVPLILSAEIIPRNGGLVPDLDDVAYLRVRAGFSETPSSAQRVTIEGAAIPGGSTTVETDEHGLAEVPVRLPTGAAAGTSHDGSVATTSLLLTIHGTLERIARVDVPVRRRVEVLPILAHPVLDAGAPVDVSLLRAPAAARLPVVVEALSDARELLAVRYAGAGERTVSLDLPPDRIGLIAIRARAIHEDESWDSEGAISKVIVRPPNPDFLDLTPARRRWVVGETASVRLTTHAGTPAHAALLVRDLSAHGGEESFSHHFLRAHFREALLTPADPAGERLVRALLAAEAMVDVLPSRAPPLLDALGLPDTRTLAQSDATRGTLRDPWPLARELERRGVATAMRMAEAQLRDAVAARTLDTITVGRGSARQFAPDLFAGQDQETLGAGPLTPAMLTAVDPSFRFETVARRVARARLIRLIGALAHYLDPGDGAPPAARMAARQPSARWLPRMVELGILGPHDLDDPWGGRFGLRVSRDPVLVVSSRATELELFSPGPDGRAGTADDLRDPFLRAVPAGTPYAVASGEDRLMRSLAVMSPIARTIELLGEAYHRINVEMTEEEIGDAVAAGVSEGTIGLGNLGTIGHGAGGGSGSGYGSGAGGLRGRRARVPQIRAGTADVRGMAAIIRERFPPTLLFEQHIEVDPSGTTDISIPLADAVTSYLIEAIVWRDDGWIWSERTIIEVDREIVIDSPVPTVARRGDRILLPLRVSNRGETPRELVVRMVGDATLGVPDSEPHPITLAAGEDAVVPIELSFDRVGEGTLSVVATSADGQALDAVRRPVRVLRPSRRVTVSRDALAADRAELVLEVPEDANPHDANVQLTVGAAQFPSLSEGSYWNAWAPMEGGSARRLPRPDQGISQMAFWIAGEWRQERATEAQVEEIIARISDVITRAENADDVESSRILRAEAAVLAGLSLFVTHRGERPMPPGMDALIARLRRDVSARVVLEGDVLMWARAAAALAWSAPEGEGRERVADLSRRIERHSVEVGQSLFVASETSPMGATIYWAMAEQALGNRARAFRLLATLRRAMDQGHEVDEAARGMARALIERMTAGEAPERAFVVIDGEERVVELVDGAAQIDARELSQPGRHVVTVRAGAPLFVRATTRFGVSWAEVSAAGGPFNIRVEGEAGAQDENTELELVVTNRVPRTIPQTVIAVELPTGAEVSQRPGAPPVPVEVGAGVMTLRVPAMRPGNEYRVRLPLRWTLAGRLSGLGVAAWADDRPDSVSVLLPAPLVIRAGGER